MSPHSSQQTTESKSGLGDTPELTLQSVSKVRAVCRELCPKFCAVWLTPRQKCFDDTLTERANTHTHSENTTQKLSLNIKMNKKSTIDQ